MKQCSLLIKTNYLLRKKIKKLLLFEFLNDIQIKLHKVKKNL